MESYCGFWVDNEDLGEAYIVDNQGYNAYDGDGQGNFSGYWKSGDGFSDCEMLGWEYSWEELDFAYYEDETGSLVYFACDLMRYK